MSPNSWVTADMEKNSNRCIEICLHLELRHSSCTHVTQEECRKFCFYLFPFKQMHQWWLTFPKELSLPLQPSLWIHWFLWISTWSACATEGEEETYLTYLTNSHISKVLYWLLIYFLTFIVRVMRPLYSFSLVEKFVINNKWFAFFLCKHQLIQN